MTFLKFFAAWLRSKWWKLRGYESLAPVFTIKRRNDRCDMCVFNVDGMCTECGCLIMAKTVLASEKCPRDFWGRIRIKKSDITT